MSKKSVKSQKQNKSVWSLHQNSQLNNKQEYFSYELVIKEGLKPSIQIEKHDQQILNASNREVKHKVIITFVGKLQECDQWGIQKQNRNHQLHKCFPSHCHLLNNSTIWNISPEEQCRCCQGSLCSLKNDLILLLYLTFTSTLIIPVNKMYKTAFSRLFQILNISVHWKKGHSYYKAIVNSAQQVGGLICWQDIIDVETLSLVLVNLHDKSKINLMDQIKKIKKRNAYNYCLKLYETKLKNKMMEATNSGQNIETEYSKIIKIIEAVYKVSSGQLILTDNNHSCETQDDDFSRKKLISKIYGLITQQDQERDEDDEDEEYDKFVYENIQELFQSEYLNQMKSNSIDSGMQIYSNVIKQVTKHMQVDRKCMFLMDVLLKSIFQRGRQQKVVHISPINREQKQNSQSQIQMLLSFEKEVTEQLLLSKSSAITQRQQVLIENTTTSLNLKQYIRYLQQVLDRRNIPYEQLGTFQSGKQQEKHMKCTDMMQNSSILLSKLSETNNQSNDAERNSMKYLQNKIKQMKKQTYCQGTNQQTQNMGNQSSSKKASSREVKPLSCWKGTNLNTDVRKQESKPCSLNKLPKPVQINSSCSQKQIGRNRTKSQKQLWRI